MASTTLALTGRADALAVQPAIASAVKTVRMIVSAVRFVMFIGESNILALE